MSIVKQPKAEKTVETTMTEEETTAKITEIKGLIGRSASAKIEIGEILIDCKRKTPHGGMESFYKSIGMNARTAQYYMQIASNEEVQKLKRENKLDGLNMTTILDKAGIRTQVRKKVEKTDYVKVTIEVFENLYMKEKSTIVLKAQYGLLRNRVTELEERLAAYGNEEAKAV